MNNQLLNSVFEMRIRIATLLVVNKRKLLSLDRIVSLDFITCYANEFGIWNSNLYGKNRYMFGELLNRKIIAQDAIKELAVMELANVSVDHGFTFSSTEACINYVNAFESDPAWTYRIVAGIVSEHYENTSDEELRRLIQNYALRE